MKDTICIDGTAIKTLVVDKNYWIVNLKPYGQDDTNDVIKSFQENCMKRNIFGIGWDGNVPKDGKRHYLGDGNKDWFCANDNEKNKMEKAKKSMTEIKKDDLVITRLHDGHIYIGKIKEPAFYQSGIDIKNRLSCMCEVEKWYEIKNQDELPSALYGRFLHRWQKTIERIGRDEEKVLMMTVYEQKSKGESDLPKIRLTKDTFSRALNPKELEDLVCAYIFDNNKEGEYMLLPSLCSTARQKYEFTLVSRNGKKPITCQVKNQNAGDIRLLDYENDYGVYEKVYLFSGNGHIFDKEQENIKIIKPNELYDELIAQKDSSMKYLRDKLERYYCINNYDVYGLIKKIIEEFENKNGECSTRYIKNNRYKVWSDNDNAKNNNTKDDNIVGVGVNGGYFSNSFGCFIVWDRDKFEKSMNAFGIEWKE